MKMIYYHNETCDWYIRIGPLHVIVWKPEWRCTEKAKWSLGSDGDGGNCLITPWFRVYVGWRL